MTLVLVILVIYLVALILLKVTNVSIAYLFAPSIFLIVIWEYIFGLLGAVNLGMETLVSSVFVALLYFLIRSREFQALVFKNVISPSSLIFLLFSTISFFKTKDWMLREWDEFSHWGTTVKAMHEFALLGPASPADLLFPEYPPGLSLFQYFVIDLNPKWSEGLLFWSLHLITFSIMAAALAGCSFKEPGELVFKSFCVLIAANAILDPFPTIYADPSLALTFGFSIFLAVKISTLGNRSAILFAATVAFLSLIKETGIYFALVAILVNVVATKIDSKTKPNSKVILFIPAILGAVVTFVCSLTWRVFVSTNSEVHGNSTFVQIAERFTKIENHSFNIEIANAFFKAFFEQILSTYNFNLLGMTGFGWTISCFALFYIFATFSGKYFSQRNLYIGLVLFFSTLIYLILLLVFYLTNFSEYEARSLASFARYVGTWYQGLFLAIVLMILSELRLNKDEFLGRTIPSSNLKFKIGSFCVFIVVLTSLSSIYPYTVMTKSNQYKGSDVRVNYNQIKSKIKSAEIPDQSKVWIISQNSSGFDYYILRYEMINLNFGEAPWSLGINDDGTDSFTDADMTIAKWSTELRKYDYVILYTISENFNAEFSSIFESGVAEQSSVYKIRKTMGTVSLVMVR